MLLRQFCSRYNADFHAAYFVDFIVVDLRKDQLLAQTLTCNCHVHQMRRALHPESLSRTRQRHMNETRECPHAVFTQRHFSANAAFAQLERCDGFTSNRHNRFCPVIVIMSLTAYSIALHCPAPRQTNINHSLGNAWNLHNVLVPILS